MDDCRAKRMLGGVMALAILGAGLARGQALKARGAVRTPELDALYASPEYERAYVAAEKAYADSRPDQVLTPVAWDSRKPLVWLQQSEQQLYRYSRELDGFRHQLETAVEVPENRENAERVAQISQLQDRLTADNLTMLNKMILGVDLTTLFTSNHKPNAAKLWTPRRIPDNTRVLDNNKMDEVVGLLDDLNTCFAESGRLHVQYASSSSFSWNVPKDENDKPLNRQQAEVFWQAYTHGPVDQAVAALYGSLRRAESVAAMEGLLTGVVPSKE